jgi:hypothetical protein
MKEVFGLFILSFIFLTSCVQNGNRSTYIISEQSKEEAPSYIQEEAL